MHAKAHGVPKFSQDIECPQVCADPGCRVLNLSHIHSAVLVSHYRAQWRKSCYFRGSGRFQPGSNATACWVLRAASR